MNKDVEMTSNPQMQTASRRSIDDASRRSALSAKSFKGTFDKPSNWIAGGVERGFRKIGLCVGTYPIIAVLVAIVFVLIFAPGSRQLEEENRGEKLWIPADTESQEDKDYIDIYYQSFARLEQVLFAACEDGTNMLTPEYFDQMLEIHKQIESLTVYYCPEEPKTCNGEEIEEGDFAGLNQQDEQCDLPVTRLIFNPQTITGNIERKCYLMGKGCFVSNVLELFNYTSSEWASQEQILARINMPSSELSDEYLNGEPINKDSLFGGIQYENGNIVSVRVLAFNYYLKNEEQLTCDNALYDFKGYAWEEGFLDYMEETVDSEGTCRKDGGSSDYEILRFATRSFDDEFGGTINTDLNFLFVAIGVIVIYALLMLSKWRLGFSGIRLFSTIASLASIGLAFICAQGLLGYAGLFTSALDSVLPFLLVGIGVDDTFVLVNAYDNTDPTKPVNLRIAEMYAAAGSSVTVTSLTNFFAFIIGSNTSLPALRNFSIFAAIGIIFIYFLQMTLFGGIFTYDSRRQKRGLYEVFCCWGVGSGCFPSDYQEAQPDPCQCATPEQWLAYAMRGLGSILTTLPGKVIVILVYVGLLIGGIVGVAKIPVDADVNDFVPPGSYLENWIDTNDDYFNTVGSSVALYFKEIAYEQPDIQEEMIEALRIMINNRFTLRNPQDYGVWLLGFRNSTFYSEALDNNKAAFVDALQKYLNNDPFGAQYQSDVVFSDDKSTILTSRFTGNYMVLDTSSEQVDSMKSLRSEIKEGMKGKQIEDDTFVYSPDFLQYEQYAQIGREVITNLGLAMLMVLVIISLMLFNLYASTLTFILIFSIVIELVGYMYWWGFSVDSVTVIFWVISLGLSVDYNVHITHGFLYQVGTGNTRWEVGNSRMQKALEETGVGIINGAFSTFLAVLCLAASESYVFVTFFRALLLVTGFGMFHGMVVLPVVLSIFQPGPHGHLLQE
eukprot:TRINITY_DN1437_c0_g1_i3.p1 TRINITY_DN1437_c0_g1~~TRINITY_DN1437_c0_g1_i3.p1  ORF type:complete len:950 (+),score=108.56 TRINITY_DN1437_c0_g1_i3:595-3444(+)